MYKVRMATIIIWQLRKLRNPADNRSPQITVKASENCFQVTYFFQDVSSLDTSMPKVELTLAIQTEKAFIKDIRWPQYPEGPRRQT